MRSKRPQQTVAQIEKGEADKREEQAGVRLRAARIHAELGATAATAREQAAPYLGGLEHLIAAAHRSELVSERIAATKELVVRYRELRRIGYMPPSLDEFIHELGREIFSKPAPEASLRLLLGKHLKSGRPPNLKRKHNVATRVRKQIYEGDSTEEAVRKVNLILNPSDTDLKKERQIRRIYDDNRVLGNADAFLAWADEHPGATKDKLQEWKNLIPSEAGGVAEDDKTQK